LFVFLKGQGNAVKGSHYYNQRLLNGLKLIIIKTSSYAYRFYPFLPSFMRLCPDKPTQKTTFLEVS